MGTFSVLPRHIGIIMDGNGRWAKQRGLVRTEGHKQGAKVFRDIATYCSELGIEAVTFYAFSTENWRRPETEVDAIMDIFRDFLDELERRLDDGMDDDELEQFLENTGADFGAAARKAMIEFRAEYLGETPEEAERKLQLAGRKEN